MNSKSINRNVWALTLSLCLGVIFTHATGYAAEERGAAGAIVSPAQFGTRLQDHDRQLTSIEALVTRIEAAKLTADKEKYSDDLSASLAAYAKAMMESFDTAMKQAELANKSQGKQGSTALLKPFEDLATQHENRMKKLDARAQKIKAPLKSSSTSEPAEGGKMARGWPMLEKISDFFISPAQAAIAITVAAACNQHPPNQTACAQAIATGVTQAAAARNTFNTCWNAAQKPLQGLKRLACTAALIVRLA
jgi:hypothetical protein